jgi:hypothetical protein
VGASSAARCPFAQDLVDLFRSEEPEGIVACRTGPMTCHAAKHRADFTPTTFRRKFNPCQPLMTFRSVFSLGGVELGMALTAFWIRAPRSPAFSLPGIPARVRGPDTAFQHGGKVKYLACGRNFVQEVRKTWQEVRN